jgi:hypothetical protein
MTRLQNRHETFLCSLWLLVSQCVTQPNQIRDEGMSHFKRAQVVSPEVQGERSRLCAIDIYQWQSYLPALKQSPLVEELPSLLCMEV